jgi:predicted site-specific integrase-resolvase
MMLQIRDAAFFLGVCTKTLRRWESHGYILPQRTRGNHRRYESDTLIQFQKTWEYILQSRPLTHIGAIYARVSGQKQKDDLIRQRDLLVSEVISQNLIPKIYQDIGSGLNDRRQGLERLIKDAIAHKFDSVYVTYLDRFSRFFSIP